MQPDLSPDSPGLKSRQAAALLVSHGANVLPESRPVPWWGRVLHQLRSPIIYILLFALAFDGLVWVMEDAEGWPFESIAIVIILGFNTIMGGMAGISGRRCPGAFEKTFRTPCQGPSGWEIDASSGIRVGPR